MRFKPFDKQKDFLLDNHRIRCLFAAKRAGKSEAAYIDTIMKAENQPNYVDNGRDPYLIAIIAPTDQMLKKLVWPKFRAFAAPFEESFNKSENVFKWNTNNSIIYGVSAEKIQRIEGLKLNHVHMTEAFQMSEYVLLEVFARTSDSQGSIVIDGSLGPQLINPKQHWLYSMFKEKQFPGTRIWEWATEDNPHFPQHELQKFKDMLDATTYKSMFHIEWDTIPLNAVYSEFTDDNIMDSYSYNPKLPTYVSVDWGWAHPAAVGFFQYDRTKDTIYLFDEIIQSKLLIEKLYEQIMAKPYNIQGYCCDVAGNQEREQIGISNIKWFKQKGIHFKHRRSAINYGIPLVRSFIKNAKGQIKFYTTSNCKKSIDGLRQYRYNEKDGIIQNENPIKKDDDAVDMIRYFFVNFMDRNLTPSTAKMIPR